MSPLAAAFAGWTPIHVLRRTPEFCLLWSWLGVERFRDPFFDQTITGALHRPLSLLLQRFATLEQLVEIAEAFPALEPTGFIYHVSRCGSTLVAQMLARLDHVIVLSEPRPLSSALEDQRLSEFDRRRAFRALVRLYGRTTGGESAYFIKFDSQNLLQWRAITAAYPEVPRLIIHRDPVEVLVSNLSQQATGLLPGEIASDRLGPPPRPLASPEDYSAFVLSRFYAAAPGSLTLDYRALPGAVASHIAPHFGLTLSAADLAAMNTATGVYSKDASRTAPFTADSASKQAESDARTRALATEWLAPHYEKLRARSATV